MNATCTIGSTSIQAHAAREAVTREIASRRKSAFQTASETERDEREKVVIKTIDFRNCDLIQAAILQASRCETIDRVTSTHFLNNHLRPK